MRVSLSWKMALGFGLIAAALIIVTGYVYTHLETISTTVTTTLSADVATIDRARGLHTLLNEEEANAQKFLVTRDPAYLRMYTRARMLTIDRLDSLETVLNDSTEIAVLDEVRRVHAWLDEAIPARTARVQIRNGQIMDSLDIAHNGLDRLVAINQDAIAHAVHAVEDHTATILHNVTVLLLGVLALTVITAFLITIAVARPLARLRKSTERIAQGDFHTIPIRSRDDFVMLVRSFNTINNRLRTIDEYKADVMQ